MTKLILKSTSGEVLKEIPLDIRRTLLKQLEDAGAEIPYACMTGMCSACMCEVETGLTQVDKSFRGEPAFPVDDRELMTCIAGAREGSEDITLKLMF
ncbi:2Fe-2S iron-sulfur cluster binding domain-containing protein [Candidatus Gracilibacteria bacterium]|nr:2Fe-2S iron-sulfur cluster binding domain-containing protein [Candidatus Gracilibacteria bacterium]